MSGPTEQQIVQEARRVLRRLSAPRMGLFARGNAFVVGRSAGCASRITVTPDIVSAFAAQGWIALDGPGRYVIAADGSALLAREAEDGFTAQHRLMQAVTLEDGAAPRTVKINVGESPLGRLRHRGLIDAVQFAAGEKLRRDFTLAQLMPRMGSNWSAPVVCGARGAGADTISDVAMAARQRVNKAMAAIGPGLSDLLFDVCCHLAALENAEDARGWARRSGRVVLKIALDRLAAHYGLHVVRTKTAIRAWSSDAAP